jgi:hypothetical protein
MRSLTLVSSFALLLPFATPVGAQQAVGFGGANPSAIVNQPVVSSSSSTLGIPLFDHSVHLRDFLPNMKTFSNSSVFGRSIYPTPDNMPGLDYLKAFGFSQPSLPTSPPTTATKKKRLPTAILLSPNTSATMTSK